MTGKALKTIRRATNMLAECGWLELTRKNHLCPFAFTVKNPAYEECQAELARVIKRINRADYIGEEIMKQFLTAIVDSVEFEDNASPGFLVNPFTHEKWSWTAITPVEPRSSSTVHNTTEPRISLIRRTSTSSGLVISSRQ